MVFSVQSRCYPLWFSTLGDMQRQWTLLRGNEDENFTLDQWRCIINDIINEDIHNRYGIQPIVEKMWGRCLRWYAYIIRTDENSVVKFDLNVEVNGKRPTARSKQRWLDMLGGNLRASRLHLEQVVLREKWLNRPRWADPATKHIINQGYIGEPRNQRIS